MVLAPVLLCSAALVLLSGRDPYWSDWAAEAMPAVSALLDGDLGGFLTNSPTYGASLLLRAPLFLLADALGAGEDGVFRAGALLGIGALAAVASYLVAFLRTSGARRRDLILSAAVIAGSPIAAKAMDYGHPEELMATALVVAGLILALRGRAVLAGVALGLAIASKQSALIAVLPAVAVAPARGRWWVAGLAGGLGLLLVSPFVLFTETFVGAQSALATASGQFFHSHQLFWPLGLDAPTDVYLSGRVAPSWLAPFPRPLIVLLSVPAAAWFARRVRRGLSPPEDVLLLVSLLALGRCLLDPWNMDYYHLPLIVLLASWEILERRRPPVLALGVTAAVWISYTSLPVRYGDLVYAVYMAWALPLAWWGVRTLRNRPRLQVVQLRSAVMLRTNARSVSDTNVRLPEHRGI